MNDRPTVRHRRTTACFTICCLMLLARLAWRCQLSKHAIYGGHSASYCTQPSSSCGRNLSCATAARRMLNQVPSRCVRKAAGCGLRPDLALSPELCLLLRLGPLAAPRLQLPLRLRDLLVLHRQRARQRLHLTGSVGLGAALEDT